MRNRKFLATLTLNTTTDETNEFDTSLLDGFASAALMISAGVPVGTLQVLVKRNDDTFCLLRSGGTAVTLVPTASLGDAVPLTSLPLGKALKVKSTGNETVAFTVEVWGETYLMS